MKINLHAIKEQAAGQRVRVFWMNKETGELTWSETGYLFESDQGSICLAKAHWSKYRMDRFGYVVGSRYQPKQTIGLIRHTGKNKKTILYQNPRWVTPTCEVRPLHENGRYMVTAKNVDYNYRYRAEGPLEWATKLVRKRIGEID